jgi:hypothetical protein
VVVADEVVAASVDGTAGGKKIKIIFPLMQRVRMLVFTAVLMYNPLW